VEDALTIANNLIYRDFPAFVQKAFYNRQLTYGYSATRVRARKTLILQKQNYEDLLQQRTTEGIIAMLERTYYKNVLTDSELLDYFTPEEGTKYVEMATEVHYKNVVNKVRTFTPKDGLPILNMLMRKWDILNLRTIISSKRTGKSWDEIYPYLVSAGELSVPELKKLSESTPDKLYLRLKAIPVGREILAHSSKNFPGAELEQMFAKALENAEVLNQLQIILDASYYNYLQDSIKSSDADVKWIKATVAKEIDLRNVMNTLRLKANGVTDPSKITPHLIRGGKGTMQYLDALLKTNSIKEVVQVIKPLFKLEKEDYATLAELEVAMQQELAKERVKIFYRSPISIATIVGFLFIKEEEMNNLRKIVRGKDYKLTPEEIRPMLVYY